MNEKQFLKKLVEENPNNFFTCNIVTNLINSQTNTLTIIQNNILSKFFVKFRKVKSADQIIKDNLSFILERTTVSDMKNLIVILMNDSNTQNIIREEFGTILEYLRLNDNISNLKIVELFKEHEDFKEINKEFIDVIIEPILDEDNMFNNIQSIKGITEDIDNRLEEALEGKKVDIAKEMLEKSIKSRTEKYNNSKKYIEDYAVTLSIKISELLDSEEMRWIDINPVGEGGFSDVYEIGSKVIKVGAPRETYNILNHRRILQPLTRTNYFADKKCEEVFACVEICDKVKTVDEKEKNNKQYKEMLYKIYKELREDSIIWTDAKFENIGKLQRENIPTFNGEEIDVDPNSIGFNEKIESEVLSKGDWVVIDTDYIYSQDDPNITRVINSFSEEFEKRWQREQQYKISQKHKQEMKTKKQVKEIEK